MKRISVILFFILFVIRLHAQPLLRNMVGDCNAIIIAYGATYAGDGIDGGFKYNCASVHADDSINYIKPTSVGGAGRWERINKKIERITITGSSAIQLSSDVTNINVNPSGNTTITVTPSKPDQIFNVKRVDNTAYTVTVVMASGTIDGASNFVEVIQYQSTQFYFDGTNTHIQ